MSRASKNCPTDRSDGSSTNHAKLRLKLQPFCSHSENDIDVILGGELSLNLDSVSSPTTTTSDVRAATTRTPGSTEVKVDAIRDVEKENRRSLLAGNSKTPKMVDFFHKICRNRKKEI